MLLKEGNFGWNKYLAVTNKRLLILRNGKSESEKSHENVAEVHVNTQTFTSLTQLKIRYLVNKEEMILG